MVEGVVIAWAAPWAELTDAPGWVLGHRFKAKEPYAPNPPKILNCDNLWKSLSMPVEALQNPLKVLMTANHPAKA